MPSTAGAKATRSSPRSSPRARCGITSVDVAQRHHVAGRTSVARGETRCRRRRGRRRFDRSSTARGGVGSEPDPARGARRSDRATCSRGRRPLTASLPARPPARRSRRRVAARDPRPTAPPPRDRADDRSDARRDRPGPRRGRARGTLVGRGRVARRAPRGAARRRCDGRAARHSRGVRTYERAVPPCDRLPAESGRPHRLRRPPDEGGGTRSTSPVLRNGPSSL